MDIIPTKALDSSGAVVANPSGVTTKLAQSLLLGEACSISASGLVSAFYNCTGLTGSVSFPKLTSIGSDGLRYAFYNCKGLTEVHFPAALSGNSQCTASNMGCSNATVYFDL